ncbi:serine/threonine protein kinase [Nonomuraea terrae]|uniref:Serine/threonine protein kinase n=1 Tax=Nonomuraea terrae TaxID=2530383 RepID=A0A4R4Z2B6_9ACTN|nr:serine/threonine-protein kinase [Nonomuraea terrae]TDD51009.1 serine/threonine protein kinase [Nonomuraea terrae]
MHPLRPEDPERIGAFEIVGLLGEGPRGEVFLGRESAEAPTVAVKVLPAEPDPGPDAPARLLGAKRVSSSYVARVLDAGLLEGRPYVVREHVEGKSLAQTVADDGPLSGDALERVAVGVLTALSAVHLAGLTHGSLTPHNVILGPDGPRVTDAALGEPAGEAAYQAPEQMKGLQYGPYADVFAWAATVVFAGTGKPPFAGRDGVLDAEPEVGMEPEPMRKVLLAALAKEARARPTAYNALMRMLGDHRGDTPSPAAAQEPVEGVPLPRSSPDAPAPGPLQGPVPGGPVLGGPVPGPVAGDPGARPVPGGPVSGVPAQGPMWRPAQGPNGGVPGQGPTAPAQRPFTQGPPPHVPPHGAPPQGPVNDVPLAGPPQRPERPMWGPPEGAPQPPNAVRDERRPPGHPAQPPRRGFPVMVVAGVGVVALVSAVGLWGATRYVELQQVDSAAAQADRGGIPAPVGTAPAQGPQGSDQAGDAQPEAVVPWGTISPDQDVGPMELPSEWTPASPVVPELTSVPSVPATPAPLPKQPVAVPTPSVSTARPTAKAKKQSSPQATVTKTVPASRTPTRRTTPTREPQPTRTSARPTPTTAKPTPTRTTAKPAPTPTKTTAKPTAAAAPVKNPHTPTQVCGSGFVVQRSSSFSGGVTYQLWNNGTGQNCAVTMKTANVGKSTSVSVTLEVQGGGSQSDSGSFQYYAGPVKLPAKGQCVRVSGSAGSGSTSTGWANCG